MKYKGLIIREKSILIHYQVDGFRTYRRLNMPPTPENIAKALDVRASLLFMEKHAPWELEYSADEMPVSVYRRLICEARKRASRKKLRCEIEPRDSARLKGQCNDRCEITGIAFSTAKIPGHHKAPFLPSIDRINSMDGYVWGNIRVVCCALNMAMNQWGEDVFRRIAHRYILGASFSRLVAKNGEQVGTLFSKQAK